MLCKNPENSDTKVPKLEVPGRLPSVTQWGLYALQTLIRRHCCAQLLLQPRSAWACQKECCKRFEYLQR